MLISKNWLRDFVFLPDAFDAVGLAAQLSLATVEVEKVIPQGADLEKIVVGKIKKVAAHPNADKLKVCTVDVGDEVLSIVCGGSNIKEEMKVAVAKLGARVRWHGQGEPIVMERATIRGVESVGMICASDEIGLADRFPKSDEKEIVDLSGLKANVGTSIAVALGLDDIIFDIDNKSLSNRPDLWGHYGLAREVAALTRKKFNELAPPKIKAGSGVISVEVREPALCPRYMAVAVEGVSTQASPEWLVRRLEAAGVRSINAIVDVTNYVMLELGQPLHAFDAGEIGGQAAEIGSIVVRRAQAGEKFITLDDKEFTLTPEMLVIADDTRALALAGIKGGKHSGVTEATTRVVFEAATFDGANIRRTSTALGLRTDSSARFEKSLDPHLPELALRRAVELTQQIFPDSRVTSAVTDVADFDRASKVLKFSWNFINERLGVEIPRKIAVDILERLGFGVQIKKGEATVAVPTWRATKDITIPEDVVEEVVRMFGFVNVPARLPTWPITPPMRNELRALERTVKKILAFECGLTEVYNYSFVALEWLRQLGVEVAGWELDNPMAKDRPLIRTALFPGLLENVRNNVPWADAIRMFEIGRVYRTEQTGERVTPSGDELLPDQPVYLGFVIAEKNNDTPFFAAAQCVKALAGRLGYALTLRPTADRGGIAHPARQAEIMVGNESVGMIGEVHPRVQQSVGILPRVAWVELSLTKLLATPRESVHYHAVVEFPRVTRDIACVVDQKITHAEMSAALRASHPLIIEVELFDVYVGEHVPAGKKSVAYHVSYQAVERTLTTTEVDEAHAQLITLLKSRYQATLRS